MHCFVMYCSSLCSECHSWSRSYGYLNTSILASTRLRNICHMQMVLTRAARGLIRGSAALSPNPETGTAPEEAPSEPGGRIAALLCFDELQISDVFTAVALKGARRRDQGLGLKVIIPVESSLR